MTQIIWITPPAYHESMRAMDCLNPITTSEELFQFVQDRFTNVTPFHVSKEEIADNAVLLEARYQFAVKVKKVRQLHLYESIPGNKTQIKVRSHSESDNFKIVTVASTDDYL